MLALVTLVLVMLALVMIRFFYTMFGLHYIVFLEKIFVYKNTLNKYNGKDVKKVFEGNYVFNNVNACIRTHCITNA